MVEVIQADRECAVRIMADRWHAKHRAAVLAGEHDNWIPVQECAHHRLTHQPDPQPQADVVERQKIVAWLRGIGAPEPFMGGIGEARPLTTATAIADAIEVGKHGEMG